MKKSLLLLAMLVGVLVMSSFKEPGDLHFVKYKQSHTVTGRVTDCADGEGIPGVSITVVGTSSVTSTDADGYYSITVSDDSFLQFSFVGYPSILVFVGNLTVFNLCLSEANYDANSQTLNKVQKLSDSQIKDIYVKK